MYGSIVSSIPADHQCTRIQDDRDLLRIIRSSDSDSDTLNVFRHISRSNLATARFELKQNVKQSLLRDKQADINDIPISVQYSYRIRPCTSRRLFEILNSEYDGVDVPGDRRNCIILT